MPGSDLRWWRRVSTAHVFLCANVRKEFSKASLCVQSRREEEGARAVMIFAELRVCAALLKEDRYHMEGVLGEGLLRAKGPRREDQDIETRGFQKQAAGRLVAQPAGNGAPGHPGTDSGP